jgi:hypothetical protein
MSVGCVRAGLGERWGRDGGVKIGAEAGDLLAQLVVRRF